MHMGGLSLVKPMAIAELLVVCRGFFDSKLILQMEVILSMSSTPTPVNARIQLVCLVIETLNYSLSLTSHH